MANHTVKRIAVLDSGVQGEHIWAVTRKRLAVKGVIETC